MEKIIDKITFAQLFCLMVFGCCMIFFFYMMHQVFTYPQIELPNEVDQIMIAIIGVMGSVVGYVVGSSASNKNKDELLKQAMNTVPVTTLPINPNNTGNTANNTSTLTLTWKGSFDTPPPNPAINDAYVDTVYNKNMYWDGTAWITTTQSPA